MNEFYTLLFYKDRVHNAFIDSGKLLMEYAAILYAAMWNQECAVAKRKAV